MKHLEFKLIVTALVLFFSHQLFSQNFSDDAKSTMSEARKLLDDSERTKTDDAKNNFEEANLILEAVDNQDFELEKYFAKGSTPKAEKKAVNVKRQRIDASVLYEKGYSNIIDAYDSRIGKLNYTFDDDKSKAVELKGEAKEKLTLAKSAMDNFKYLDDKDLISYKYYTLQDQVEEANKLFRDAIDIQLEAFSLFLNQDERQAEEATAGIGNAGVSEEITNSLTSGMDEATLNQIAAEFDGSGIIEVTKDEGADPVVTNRASSEPEEITYEEAIADLPVAIEEGVESVEEPVATIVEKGSVSDPYNEPAISYEPVSKVTAPVATSQSVVASATSTAAMSTVDGVVFRVQLIAVKKGPLSVKEQAKLYSGSETIMERQEEGMYKYTIGEFKTFREARNFRNNLQTKDTFIVSFRDGKRIPLDEAIGYAY